jgi:hypothetical protein
VSINGKNSAAETIVKGSAFKESPWEDNYPDPNTLPPPSQDSRIEDVTLSELVSGRYVSATARVVYLRAIEKQDALGSKMIFSGILEDSKFKVLFVSHRISYPLIRNCVYKFHSAYVHEFPEKSLLLVITEHTKISPKDVEDYREYIWKPTVDSIRRPVKSVALRGVITTVHGNSGLIKRCNKCKSSYRSSNKIIISDGRNLVYFPPGEEDEHKFSEYVKRSLNISEIEGRKIVRKLIEKAVDIGIRKVTGMRKMQGIYLLEEPVPLYRCEQAKLYLGFSFQVIIREEKNERGNNIVAVIEATPQSYVRESVLDYVRLRRGRGACANSVIRNLTKYRNKVIVAPSGNYGCIVDVISRKAGSQRVSDNDHRNLVEFWKQIYGIDISPDEIPLLKVKMINSENVFTYPSSMCFFGTDSFFIPAYVQKFVEYKRFTIKSRMDKVIQELVNEEECCLNTCSFNIADFSVNALCRRM